MLLDVPYIGVSNGYTGGLLALLKVGFKTTGDNSDTSKPRIVPTQNGVYNLPADLTIIVNSIIN